MFVFSHANVVRSPGRGMILSVAPVGCWNKWREFLWSRCGFGDLNANNLLTYFHRLFLHCVWKWGWLICFISPADTCWLDLFCSSYVNLPAKLSCCNNFLFLLIFHIKMITHNNGIFFVRTTKCFIPSLVSFFMKLLICVVFYPVAPSSLGLCLLSTTLD